MKIIGPIPPLRVRRVEEYDTSDDARREWYLARAARRSPDADLNLHLLGIIAADGALEGHGSRERIARLMQLADDYERDPIDSVLMHVLSGKIDLSSFVKADE